MLPVGLAYDQVFRTLNECDVRYIVIGGLNYFLRFNPFEN